MHSSAAGEGAARSERGRGERSCSAPKLQHELFSASQLWSAQRAHARYQPPPPSSLYAERKKKLRSRIQSPSSTRRDGCRRKRTPRAPDFCTHNQPRAVSTSPCDVPPPPPVTVSCLRCFGDGGFTRNRETITHRNLERPPPNHPKSTVH